MALQGLHVTLRNPFDANIFYIRDNWDAWAHSLCMGPDLFCTVEKWKESPHGSQRMGSSLIFVSHLIYMAKDRKPCKVYFTHLGKA